MKSRRELIEELLRYLEEKQIATYEEISQRLEVDESYLTALLDDLSGVFKEKPIDPLIKQKCRISDESARGFEITIKGLEYLGNLETRKLQKQQTRLLVLQTKFNKYLATATIILAFFTAATFVFSALNLFPRV